MVEAIECVVLGDVDAVRGAMVRYEMLERMWRNTRNQGVTILAFGMGRDRFRWLLSGESKSVTEALRGFKVGTCRRSGGDFRLSSWERTLVEKALLTERVHWVHSVPWSLDNARTPLNPWTSELDRLGYRDAPFFDPVPLRALVGSSSNGTGGERQVELRESYSLCFLMRLAAAVVGRLPGHQKSFRLFVQLARFFGWDYSEIASALQLTVRRVRQLDQGREPLLWTALLGLAEPRLAALP